MDSLHDLGFDTERISVEQYSALLTKITEQLAAVQKQSGAKLLWVKTTPVPTVPMYGPGCNDTRTWCAASILSPWPPSGCRLAVLCDADRARCQQPQPAPLRRRRRPLQRSELRTLSRLPCALCAC